MGHTKKALFARAIRTALALEQVSEMEIVYRRKKPIAELSIARSSHDMYQILSRNWSMQKINLCEQFKVCLLNRSGRILGICEISSGGISSTVVEPSFIIGLAIISAANSIILSHNHPSGNTQPSDADIDLTKKIKMAAEFFDIKLLDHIIITDTAYYSFADSGKL